MSIRKTVLLIGLLFIPVAVFLFLKTFGVSHYTLPTYYAMEVDSTRVATGWQLDTIYHKIPDFQLTSQQGHTVTQRDLDNTVYVASFFFTSCSGPCKEMNTELVRVQDAFRNYPQVKIVSHTVHPEHDSVEVLQRYADRFNADPSKWYFLTGDREKIYHLAQTGYGLVAQQAPGVLVDFLHAEQFLLIDWNKHVRGIYHGTNSEDVDRLITEIGVLLDEMKKNENESISFRQL
jgi:protein SCO1/2